MGSEKPEHTELQAHDGKPNTSHATVVEMTRDEYTLATLGYRQVFVRSFGLFENVGEAKDFRLFQMLIETSWAATFTTMNFVSGVPVLFGFAMYVCSLRGL
jgi:hypothetical protein